MASSFKNRVENHSNGITDLPGVEHFGDLTPFQNQVLDAAETYENEKEKERMEEARNNGSSGSQPQRNPKAGAGGGASGGSTVDQEETVRYVNKDHYPDHNIHESN